MGLWAGSRSRGRTGGQHLVVAQLVESAATHCLSGIHSQQVAATFSLLADAVASGGFLVFCSRFGCFTFGE